MNARIGIALGLFAIATPAHADIDGKYKNDYSDETGGSEYPLLYGSATVKKMGKLYFLTHSGVKHLRPGPGIKAGASQVFFCLPVAGSCGIAVYKIQPGGGFKGTWTAEEAKGKIGTEDWAESGAAAGTEEDDEEDNVAGTYTVTGTNPGGTGQYRGTVEVVRESGDKYKVTWSVAGQTYTGVGIEEDGYLGVAYGSDKYWIAGYGAYKKILSGYLFSSGFEAPANLKDADMGTSDSFADTQKKK
jgi:hypothetical protein